MKFRQYHIHINKYSNDKTEKGKGRRIMIIFVNLSWICYLLLKLLFLSIYQINWKPNLMKTCFDIFFISVSAFKLDLNLV